MDDKDKYLLAKEQPARFAVELGQLDVDEAQIEDIQNAISRAVLERVKGLGSAASDIWASFDKWVSFGQSSALEKVQRTRRG